ncbi:MAG: GNAT family N-acetyltransferase [Gemmatimonadota bacterium]|nr:GNAT family N-acetyltransferase [Gemmatimonadota bacterium]
MTLAVGRITGLAVADDEQGTGVGRLLVTAAERYCFERVVSRVEVTSGPTHLPAHQFYRQLGYGDQGVRFAKSLVHLPDAS